jgi:hypothetical protein
MLRVRRRANLEGAIQFITDPEVIDNINVAIAAWWDLVTLTTFQGQISRQTWSITTSSNVSAYALAPNTARVISVDAFISGNTYVITAMPYQEEQRNMFKLLPFVGWSFGAVQSVWYQIQGTNINFLPTPTANYNLVVNYEATSPVLSQPSDVLNSVNGWEEYVVLKAAILCLIKEGNKEMIAQLRPWLQDEEDRIKACAGQMDVNASEGVHESEAYGNWGLVFR